MSAVERVEILGRPAKVFYLDGAGDPCEPQDATFMRAFWDDGTSFTLVAPDPIAEALAHDAFDPSEKRDEKGEWTTVNYGTAKSPSFHDVKILRNPKPDALKDYVEDLNRQSVDAGEPPTPEDQLDLRVLKDDKGDYVVWGGRFATHANVAKSLGLSSHWYGISLKHVSMFTAAQARHFGYDLDKIYNDPSFTSDEATTEPRLPAGTPSTGNIHGGEWTAGGAGSASPSQQAPAVQPLAGSKGGDPMQVSTSLITGTGRSAAEKAQAIEAKKGYRRVGMSILTQEDKDKLAPLLRNKTNYPGIKPGELKGLNHDQVLRFATERMKENLHALYDHASKANIAEWRKWYEGAHSIAAGLAAKHKINGKPLDVASMAGAIACLSPQTMWDINVVLAVRVLDILEKQHGHAWDADMSREAHKWFEGSSAPMAAVRRNIVEEMEKGGWSFDQIPKGEEYDKARALWVRSYDAAHTNDRGYKILSISGHRG